MFLRPYSIFLLILLGLSPCRSGADIEFFEKRIRPVLVAECYQCHAGEKSKGSVRLDFRDGIRSGSMIVPGNPAESRLLQALRHELPDLEMPKDGAKLDSAVLRDFEQWIAAGATDPRDHPAAAAVVQDSWQATMAFRKQWWSFQPIQSPEIPLARNDWSSHPVDRFLLARMRDKGLNPVAPASQRALIRRLYFALTGLPPMPAEFREALELSHSELVDRLLNSKHFGERWARHWMDWFRYAESHGSEGDPKIPHAYRYRDYLIRALNADVPYDQLIREHIAGDLLPDPRVNEELGLNESAHGIAQLRLVQHGYQPTEPQMERVRFVDDQVDVVSKAFLGLTVSCARCHDHKFDPISQDDYFALFGIFRSAMPGIVSVDAPGRLDVYRDRLNELKAEIREAVAVEWMAFADRVPALLESEPGLLEKFSLTESDEYVSRWRGAISSATQGNVGNPFHIWNQLKNLRAAELSEHWGDLRRDQQRVFETNRVRLRDSFRRGWNPTTIQSEWFTSGTAWQEGTAKAGAFFLAPSGDAIIRGIYPRGMYSHLVSSKHNGVLNSPKFTITSDSISVRLMGNDLAQARLVVGDYPVPRGGIYGQRSQPVHENLVWYKWDTTYWKGEEAHIEVATQDDLMIFVKAYRGGGNPNTSDGRSYVGITDVVFNDAGQSKPEELFSEAFEILRRGAPADRGELAEHYRDVLRNAVEAWRTRNLDDYQAKFLNFFVERKLLPNTRPELPGTKELVAEYRRLENGIPVATRSSGVIETMGRDQPLLDRGDFKRPGEPVTRRFLGLFEGADYETKQSGRLELAHDLVRLDNPLMPRVLVNRVWAYLFGEGLVASTDNFGRLGRKPTHPQLLDHLAGWFVANDYSLKRLIAYLTKTRAYQLASVPGEGASATDPADVYLSHFRVRRLDAEAIRDSILAASGRLDRTMFGVSQPGTGNRRSIYVRSPRNNRDKFLKIFDAPEPLSTKGKRDVTNVPAQSLALLNYEFVRNSARVFGERLAGMRESDRIDHLLETFLGRVPTEIEIANIRGMQSALLDRGNAIVVQRRKLDMELSMVETELAGLLEPVRERIRAEKPAGSPVLAGPTPIALWDFEESADELLSGLPGTFDGNARIEDGALVVNGGVSHALSGKLPFSLAAKTLEAWVQLDDLTQRGGGVLSVQTPDGRYFDAIVFGEKEPGKWLAGSDRFSRTQSFGGARDTEAASRVVHMAIVYSKDGTITGYRDGEPYGRSYKSSGPRVFQADATVVAFGLRHLKAGGNRMLKGRIHEARIYDRALSAEEVSASAGRVSGFVSEKQILGRFTAGQRSRFDALKKRLGELGMEIESLREQPVVNERTVWGGIAHAMFNLKEFIYIR